MKFTTTWLLIVSTASVALANSPVDFVPSSIKGHFVEQFTSDWNTRWNPSQATKDQDGETFSYVGKWEVEESTVYPGINGDEGLVVKSKAAHHGISALFDKPLDPKDKTLVVQYEVKLQNGLDCGGAYLKLLTDSAQGIQAEEFSDKTPYTIMFGPDRCGATSKVHFIFRHKNPISGEIEEKHLTQPPSPPMAKTSTLYTLIVRPDQSVEIKINGDSVKNGTLLEDFAPAVNPAKEINDPEDKKPADWVDAPQIADPAAVKPEDWDEDAPEQIEDDSAVKPADWYEDEPATIPDPDAVKPEEWSDEDDGDWEAPMVANPKCETGSGCGPWTRPKISNPEYKGKWSAPMIDNPLYKGPWAARKIPNPNYFEDNSPSAFTPISGVGFELWTMTDGILFDNIYIGTSEKDAEQFALETFKVKLPIEEAAAAKAKPEEDAKATESSFDAPAFTKDPLGYVQYRIQKFMDVAVVDPVAAFRAEPTVGGSILGFLAGVLALLTSAFAAVLPSKKTVVETKTAIKKKTDEVTEDVKDKADEAAEVIEDKKEEVKEGVRTRARKSQAADEE